MKRRTSLFFVGSMALLSVFFVFGCNQARGRAAVMEKYPGAEVVNVPDSKYEFIIRKADGSIWYCVSGGMDKQTNNDVEIMPKNR